MSEPDRCRECGAEMPTGALAGLCPKCLMAAGLESGDDQSQSAGSRSTTPHAGSFVPPEPAVLAGHFPQLEILELLGHGGMGAVYKARQNNLDRLVALKIIRPESADTPAFEERFNREAKMLARLSHPHIVAMHEFGEVRVSDAVPGGPQRPLYYFLMEYVDGANLRQLMRAGELTPEQALAIVPQICEALQFAHDEGVVHRDIKPENILLDKRGRVKIADFGLAKLAAGSPEEFTLTGTHQVMGTPRYMAPEQMEGSHAVDHRADIFSLGIVFYEMLTGEVPAGHFEPPSKKVAIDVRLDEVVLRAMAREPERRYQQAGDVKTDMESISSTPRPRTPEPFPEAAADDAQIQASRQLVQFPAIGLIVVGSFLTAAAAFAAFTMASWASGRGSQTSSDGSEVLLIVAPILALVALPAAIIIGGVKMLRLTDYGWAVGASVLAVSPIPSAPVWFLSLPLGIWSLVVLSKPEVKRGFALRRNLPRGEQAALAAAASSNVPESPSQSRQFWMAKAKWVAVVVLFVAYFLGFWPALFEVSDIMWALLFVLCLPVFAFEAVRHRGEYKGQKALFALLAGSLVPMLYLVAQPQPLLSWVYRFSGGEPHDGDPTFLRLIAGVIIVWIVWQMIQLQRTIAVEKQPSDL